MTKLIDFPGPPGPHTEPVNSIQEGLDKELEALKGAQTILKNITDKRKKAVETLQNKVQSLDDSDKLNAEHMSPGSVELLRDVRRSLNETLSALEAHDDMLDMITNDLVGIVGNFEQHSMATQRTSILLQSMVILLLDKGVVTNEEFKTSQMKVINEIQEGLKARQK